MPLVQTVFLFDVDNTLLDHDRVTADLRHHLEFEVGPERARHYWEIFESIRAELGYADYLGALQQYRLNYPHDSHLLAVSYFLMQYPFAERLFPRALDVIARAKQVGSVAILTDGDVVFQPLKIYRSGLFDAFEGNVLIYVCKEKELADVEQRYPAESYVVVDDKIRILAAIKKVWKSRVTTVFVRQGHYANDTAELAKYPPADLSLERFGELLKPECNRLFEGSSPAG
jgi:FMN phosphatase YigB (HAD superfamily)